MFTGLVEEIGSVRTVRSQHGGRRIAVQCRTVLAGLQIDDSIAVDGVCQTVVALGPDYFEVEAVPTTLQKTTLGRLQAGSAVNLERAMALGHRLGGHLVQGHVDCTGTVSTVAPEGNAHSVHIEFPAEFRRYLIPVGSICINGISLTVAGLEERHLRVAIIPHTWACTTISRCRPGTPVNLEFDLIAKYVESLLRYGQAGAAGITPKSLKKMGY